MKSLLLVLSVLALAACNTQKMSTNVSDGTNSNSITHGSPVKAGEDVTKWTVALGPKGDSYCTGVIIDRHHVVSAAHCTEAMTDSQVTFSLNALDGKAESRKIKNLIRHEAYCEKDECMGGDTMGLNNDILLIEFEGELPAGFEPAPIADDSDLKSGDAVLMVGFGLDHNGDFDGIMKETKAPVVEVSASEFLTDEKKSGTCNGDSGGPIFVEKDGKLKLMGLTSRGDGPCRHHGIYTKVPFYFEWILNKIVGAAAEAPVLEVVPAVVGND